MASVQADGRAALPSARSRSRRTMLILLFVIGIVAYADRQVIALLKPVLDREFGWSAADYATISSWSQLAIAFSLLASGWVTDRFGVRWTLGAGLAGWSLATVLHAAVSTVSGFLGVRIALGVFEGVGTPATMKAMAQYFAPDARGRMIGLLNAAPNLAAMLAPLLVSALSGYTGWRGTIVIVGSIGLVCTVLWFSQTDATHVPARVDVNAWSGKGAATSRPVVGGTGRRLTAAFALGKFLTDPVWWFLLFWLPDILHRRYGLDTAHLGAPLAVAYAMAALGSIIGGYAPAMLAGNGLSHERARRVVMGLAALCVLPLPLVLWIPTLGWGVLICGLALAAHQTFAVNLFGLLTEWLPHDQVGRGTGIGAFCGNIGGALALHIVGGFVAAGQLLPVLGYCAVAYVLGWGVLILCVPVRSLVALRKRADANAAQ
ncbi:MFS transporter [Neoasaia chiangmaiensis]|uniref:MFS transporter n=1 Tax=Neoasaia chiangmaiensis TaxID=320497 RepID=A0A1U9KM20_9PROT|nr:MFS transporter [Neoasaia chiangmaiensis]AQS86808.1 MFS transporter [Neoasaia chiangmaiensis]GEN16322.1 MFS transporter [Neoasaia chiangmaiensis]